VSLSPLKPESSLTGPLRRADGSFAVVLYPIYESREAIGDIFSAMKADLKGKRTPKVVAGSE